MKTQINGKQFNDSLSEKLDKDSSLLKDVGNIMTFSACVLSGEPSSLSSLIPIILKASGSAISSSINILKRFSNPNSKISKSLKEPRDKFPLIFYLFIQQSYLEALKEKLEDTDVSKVMNGNNYFEKLKKDDFIRYKETIVPCLEDIIEGGIQFGFCIDPTNKEIPLFNALKKWLFVSLESHGAERYWAKDFATSVEEMSRQLFHQKIASEDSNAKWIREYLVLEYVEVVPKISSDLSSIKKILENWTHSDKKLKEKHRSAWERYREVLKCLPDDKDTMYNESFGVRDVFVAPQVKYYISGIEGDVGTPQDVPNISNLIGALVSNRISGDDLIILCGGPGSGKSTLCRMIASELSCNPDIHPVFLKLRRCNEGLDICSFVADNLRNAGVIQDISDLHDVPNLILILDGFDELVMASRQRLRLFFNHLQDDLRTGPFRNAKAIISGRDTLFPGGQGLPRASHILTLLPFCKKRVIHWGKKWNKINKDRLGGNFKPEIFFEDDQYVAKHSALHHLVTWPLTLHLVAQVHAAGHLDTTDKSKRNIEKAYLYRGILAETARRQEDKRPGAGLLDKERIREYLRSLAWEMYIRSVDSLDIDDAIPIIERFFPKASQDELQMISDTNVLNAPEIQKKEETGFEFVHKSFSEYLVAERFASILEDVCYKVPDRVTKKTVWHMSSDDVTQKLTGILGLRIFPTEVQEMLEPMLGCFEHFLKKTHVKDIVPSTKRTEGLVHIIQRFNEIYENMLKGTALRRTQDATEGKLLIESPLEAYSNYAAGVAIIGSAAVNQLNGLKKKASKMFFQGNPFEGAFWKFIWILQAGGIRLDNSISQRLFSGMTVNNTGISEVVGDWEIPLYLSSLSNIDGYKTNLVDALNRLTDSFDMLNLMFVFERILPNVFFDEKSTFSRYDKYNENILREKLFTKHIRFKDSFNTKSERYFYTDHSSRHFLINDDGIRSFIKELIGANFVSDTPIHRSKSNRSYRELSRRIDEILHHYNIKNDSIDQERLSDEIYDMLRYILREAYEKGLINDKNAYRIEKEFKQRLRYMR